MRIVTDKGDKDFEFDRTFAHTDGQAQVRVLLLSAVLGVLYFAFFVCFFACSCVDNNSAYAFALPEIL